MAWSTLRQQGALQVDQEVGYRSASRVIVSAVLINILNPKLSIFFFAFLPQFVSTAEAHPLSRMLELSAVFMLLTFVVFVGYGLFAASVRARVVSRPRVLTWMRRAFAGALSPSAPSSPSPIADDRVSGAAMIKLGPGRAPSPR